MYQVGFATLICVALAACGGGDDWYGRGFTDGYAVGYNTACEIRTTMVHGDWKNEDYSRGYSEGMTDGIANCNADRKAGIVK